MLVDFREGGWAAGNLSYRLVEVAWSRWGRLLWELRYFLRIAVGRFGGGSG